MRRVYFTFITLVVAVSFVYSLTTVAATCDAKTTLCNVNALLGLKTSLDATPKPAIAEPGWMRPAVVTSPKTAHGQPVTVTYNVETRGVLTASLAEFKEQAHVTLNDARGWSRMNVTFVETVEAGTFSLVLARPEAIGAVPGCGAEYSCRSGRYVMINEDRWQGATPAWNAAGGSLRDYRHMVVNHETGHWLGHSHQSCGGAGQQAPVMQQQSIDLQSCTFNPWPLASELWSTALGIAV